jgi:hypothetical protein
MKYKERARLIASVSKFRPRFKNGDWKARSPGLDGASAYRAIYTFGSTGSKGGRR